MTTLPTDVVLESWSYRNWDTGWSAGCLSDPCLSCTLAWSEPTWLPSGRVGFVSSAGSECTGNGAVGWVSDQQACNFAWLADSAGGVYLDFQVVQCPGGFCAVDIQVVDFLVTEAACIDWEVTPLLNAAVRDEYEARLRGFVWSCP